MVQPMPRRAGVSLTEALIWSLDRLSASVNTSAISVVGNLAWKVLLKVATTMLLATLPAA